MGEPPATSVTYRFDPVSACNMCAAPAAHFVMAGLRLNQSQGLRPRRAAGIAVSIKRCAECGLIFPDPQPVPASLSDHYGDAEDYWHPDYFTEHPDYFSSEIAQAKRLLASRDAICALDIGAGIGKAMKAMSRAGFEAHGLEPWPSARAMAIERMNIPADRIVVATAEDAALAPESFDFITFGAVLEHLYSPSQAIERALGWLKPGGIIQAEVPSSRHLISRMINLFYRLRGTNYVTNTSPMHSPFHLYEFGLKSFEAHGRSARYEIAHHEVRVCEIYHVPRFLHPPLRWIMARSGTGMQLTVYLRKA